MLGFAPKLIGNWVNETQHRRFTITIPNCLTQPTKMSNLGRLPSYIYTKFG